MRFQTITSDNKYKTKEDAMAITKRTSHQLNTNEICVHNSHNTEGEILHINSPLIPETRVEAKCFKFVEWFGKELISSFINSQCQPFWQAFDEFVQQIDLAALSEVLLHCPSLCPIYAQIAIVGLVMVSPCVLTAVVNIFAQFQLSSPLRWLISLRTKSLVRASVHQLVLEGLSKMLC